MPRKILTEAEREERRKERNRRVVEGTRHYTGERGSPSQWAAAAEDVVYHRASPTQVAPEHDPLLIILGLEEMPKTVEELRVARRRAMKTAHADKGGTHAHAVAVNEAYDKILERIR